MAKTWRQLLAEAKKLTDGNGVAAWRVAQIIRDVYKDSDYAADCGDSEETKESRLADYAGKFALGVFDMINMIEHFPNKEDWERGRLDILRDKTAVEMMSERRPSGKHRRGPVSRREYEKVLSELAEAKHEIRMLKSRIKELERDLQVV